MHVRTCTPRFYISGTAGPIGCWLSGGLVVVEDQSAKEFPRVGWGIRAHVHIHFLYLRDALADRVQIRHVLGDGSTNRFP